MLRELSPSELAELRHDAESVAREVGQQALGFFERVRELDVTNKGPQDYVTEADREVEHLLRERLTALQAGIGMVGEEHGAEREPGQAAWCVDPIDGTSNFIRGIPGWCVSIGLLDEESSWVGIVFDPCRDELFAAHREGGCTRNGQTVRVSGQGDATRSLMGLGRSHRTAQPPFAQMVGKVIGAGGAFRKLGSAALTGAWAAAGRLDGFAELHINAWDFAAIQCLLVEAGAYAPMRFDEPTLAEGAPFLGITPELREWFEPLFLEALEGAGIEHRGFAA